jgi:hypothetical protein
VYSRLVEGVTGITMTIVARRVALVCCCAAAILNCSSPEDLFDDLNFAGAAGTKNGQAELPNGGGSEGKPSKGKSSGGKSSGGKSSGGKSSGGKSSGGKSSEGKSSEGKSSEGDSSEGGESEGGASEGGASGAATSEGGESGASGASSSEGGTLNGGSGNGGVAIGGAPSAGTGNGGIGNGGGDAANSGGGSVNAGGGSVNAGGGSANAGGGSANAGGGSANAGSSSIVTPTITLLNPTTLVRGYSALFVMGTDLSGAQLTIGGKLQVVTSNSESQLVVAPIASDTPAGTQPIVVSNAAGASAPGYVDVLAQLKLESATADSATRVKVTFNRALNSASVLPARFIIAGLTVSSASSVGAIVTLTTSAQTSGASYAVGASPLVVDIYSSPAASEGITFTGSN